MQKPEPICTEPNGIKIYDDAEYDLWFDWACENFSGAHLDDVLDGVDPGDLVDEWDWADLEIDSQRGREAGF